LPLDGRLAAEFPPLAAADTKNISGLTLVTIPRTSGFTLSAGDY